MTGDPRPLTARQRQVAELVADGTTNSGIARRLGISRRTVEAHLAMIALRIPGSAPPRERILLYVLAQTHANTPHKGAA
jgi:FixJ family two-component response regulator